VRVLWLRAPLLLRRHLPVLAAVVLTTALAALAAASVPLVRAAVQSESLKGQLANMTPLSAGLEIRTLGNRYSSDDARRAAAIRLGHTMPSLGPPVISTMQEGFQLAGPAGAGLEVTALARTGAVDQVRRLTGGRGQGVWVADSIAGEARLRPGDTVRLTVHHSSGVTPTVAFRVAGVYRALEGDRDNPYWANWQQDIRPLDPDSPPPPPFVLMSQRDVAKLARVFYPLVENRYEYPVDPRHITFAGAQSLDERLARLSTDLVRPRFAPGRALMCTPRNCQTSSSLSAALTVAATEVAAVSPTISLLSDIGLLIAFALSVAAGLFLVRRRADEAHVLFARGESTGVFAARTAVEAALPGVVGLAAGAGVALLALEQLAPDGAVTHATVEGAMARAAIAAAAGVGCVALGAAFGFPRRGGVGPCWAARVERVPWEVVPLALATGALAAVLAGKGLAGDATGTSHPRLVVFVFPVLLATGVAGLVVRILRALLQRTGDGAGPIVFLAMRRVGTARGLLVAVVVAAAAAFATFAYASTLSSSLDRSAAEKALVSNGSDVQGFVDPNATIPPEFDFPAAVVEIDPGNAAFASGEPVDVIAGDPNALARTLLWGEGWGDDPRRFLSRLGETSDGALAAIATPGAPEAEEIIDQGARIRIEIVGRAPLPGSTAGRAAILVSRAALRRAARRLDILDPGPQATGLLWAKGDPARLEQAIDASNVGAVYLTRLGHIRENASVAAAERSYGFVRAIGAAAAILSLVALLLYLQARQRSQLIASALVRRMGLAAGADAAALALEAAAVVLVAAVTGAVAAVTAAQPIAHRIDSLPLYAPPPVLAVPWATLVAGGAVAVAAGALLGAAAATLAARADVGEALRVA
jgi:putative ABC transport system permease protein